MADLFFICWWGKESMMDFLVRSLFGWLHFLCSSWIFKIVLLYLEYFRLQTRCTWVANPANLIYTPISTLLYPYEISNLVTRFHFWVINTCSVMRIGNVAQRRSSLLGHCQLHLVSPQRRQLTHHSTFKGQFSREASLNQHENVNCRSLQL